MGVQTDLFGRRFVQVTAAVPGTREQVWQAISTGAGISAWFVPAEVEEREGGKVVFHFGPGMDSVSTATEWEPLERFVAEHVDPGPGEPPMVTEWAMEEGADGGCVVRVEHSVQTESTQWDGYLESVEAGWPGFFCILRLYLTHFPGWQSKSFLVMGSAAGEEEAWKAMVAGLGVSGETWQSALGSGVVEETQLGGHAHSMVLRMVEPAPGLISAGAFPMRPKVGVMVSAYLYGDGAAEGAARLEPLWSEWMKQNFPAE
jgi:uncharacterized protein YndB with AHSA1/START domain